MANASVSTSLNRPRLPWYIRHSLCRKSHFQAASLDGLDSEFCFECSESLRNPRYDFLCVIHVDGEVSAIDQLFREGLAVGFIRMFAHFGFLQIYVDRLEVKTPFYPNFHILPLSILSDACFQMAT